MRSPEQIHPAWLLGLGQWEEETVADILALSRSPTSLLIGPGGDLLPDLKNKMDNSSWLFLFLTAIGRFKWDDHKIPQEPRRLCLSKYLIC